MTRLIHLSDLHFGAHDPALVEDLVRRSHALRPDVVVISGDFTQGGRRSEFQAARGFIERLNAPTVIARGNHDAPAWAWHERVMRPWHRLDRSLGAVSLGAWSGERVSIESFSTSPRAQLRLDWSLGQVRSRSLQRAVNRLADLPQDRVRILTCHHPLVAPHGAGRRARTWGARSALKRVEKTVDLVLTGHLHQAFAMNRIDEAGNTCWYIGASTAFSDRTREEPAGFNVVAVEDQHLQLDTFAATSAATFQQVGRKRLNVDEQSTKIYRGPSLVEA